MQKWEYWCDSYAVDRPSDDREAGFGDLGDDGWEIVSEYLVGDRVCVTFKRPKDSP